MERIERTSEGKYLNEYKQEDKEYAKFNVWER